MIPRVVVSGPIRHGQVRVSCSEPVELVYGPAPDGAYVGRDRAGNRVRVLPGERQRGVDGQPMVCLTTCGHCGRTWDDALITSMTPVPSGRCPFEYDHIYSEETV